MSLSLEASCILTEVEDYVLPTFHNLTHLRLGAESGSCWNWDLLKDFLRCSPNIEVLILERTRILDSAKLWRPRPQVPSCLALHLREIEIPQFDGKEYQLDLIKYLLENAKVLKKMTIGYLDSSSCVCNLSEKLKESGSCFCRAFSAFSRGSKTCELNIRCRN
ncbi:putative F-box/FBD/LRR-repeat protein At5g44950 [Rhododendron vialii]|uniref:putative F-box/FBD/LRR-repeat protein At5g44950 n=1 Tax=Rhododendron vialii TaxID=182163 RepID=UPI00265ED3A2|nr:putative F-box/FBD/LRR-repeat protein At5g44950 [Rhododendron vialii]